MSELPPAGLQPANPPYPAPNKPKWEEDGLDKILEELKKHLQTALLVESYTIPLYLFAFYSIEDPDADAKQITRISKEEMLHLALAGNILCAIGGTPVVYDYAPTFPSYLFYEQDRVTLNLKPATKETIDTFVQVERPQEPRPMGIMAKQIPEILNTYGSIGEFYESLIEGIKTVNKRFEEAGRQLFDQSTTVKQFDDEDDSWPMGGMIVIKKLQDAIDALQLIITQGEGSTASATLTAGQKSHYDVFRALADPYKLKTRNIVENIDPENYKSEKFYVVLRLSDAIYSYLLMSIEKLGQYGPSDRQKRLDLITANVRGVMGRAIRPISQLLVKQEIGNSGTFAAPPFRKYKFSATYKTELDELKALAAEAAKAYKDLSSVETQVNALKDLRSLE